MCVFLMGLLNISFGLFFKIISNFATNFSSISTEKSKSVACLGYGRDYACFNELKQYNHRFLSKCPNCSFHWRGTEVHD